MSAPVPTVMMMANAFFTGKALPVAPSGTYYSATQGEIKDILLVDADFVADFGFDEVPGFDAIAGPAGPAGHAGPAGPAGPAGGPSGTYNNKTSKRALGITYTNWTLKTIHVLVFCSGDGILILSVGGVTLGRTVETENMLLSFPVPAGASYSVTGEGAPILTDWWELF